MIINKLNNYQTELIIRGRRIILTDVYLMERREKFLNMVEAIAITILSLVIILGLVFLLLLGDNNGYYRQTDDNNIHYEWVDDHGRLDN